MLFMIGLALKSVSREWSAVTLYADDNGDDHSRKFPWDFLERVYITSGLL